MAGVCFSQYFHLEKRGLCCLAFVVCALLACLLLPFLVKKKKLRACLLSECVCLLACVLSSYLFYFMAVSCYQKADLASPSHPEGTVFFSSLLCLCKIGCKKRLRICMCSSVYAKFDENRRGKKIVLNSSRDRNERTRRSGERREGGAKRPFCDLGFELPNGRGRRSTGKDIIDGVEN